MYCLYINSSQVSYVSDKNLVKCRSQYDIYKTKANERYPMKGTKKDKGDK